MAENTKEKVRTQANKFGKRIKVIIEPRFEEDMNKVQDFVGFNGYTATFKYGEVIEMPEKVVEFLKGKGRYKTYVKDGDVTKRWEKKFIIEFQ